MANLQKRNKRISSKQFKVLSIAHLAAKADMSYNRLYNNLAGIYAEINLTDNEKTILINTVHDEMKKFFDILGFKIQMKRKAEDD